MVEAGKGNLYTRISLILLSITLSLPDEGSFDEDDVVIL
tara:strand:+ start:322 stop:438 length:117 start_codon:yes stop_codon:yes gene_type:complete